MKRTLVAILMILFLTNISFNFIPFKTQASSPTTTFYVYPPSIIDPFLTPSDNFIVQVMVSDAVDLYSWQVCMCWDSAVLNATETIFGDFLADQPEGTYQLSTVYNDLGMLAVGEGTYGPYLGVNGSGWLCSIKFLVETVGETVLDISGLVPSFPPLTYYMNSTLDVIGDEEGELIKENGYFNNFGQADPIEALEELIETIETWDLPKGTQNSLTSKLTGALHLLDIGNENGAIHKLMDFMNQVEALRGKKLTNQEADELISEAQRIMDLI